MLRGEKMSFTVNELAWDTEFFGFPCANIDITGILSEKDAAEMAKLSQDYRFITVHNPDTLHTNEKIILRFLNAVKTDVNVRLCNLGPAFQPFKARDGYSVLLSCSLSIGAEVFDAVRGSFVHSRFYQDEHISVAKADGVFYNWLKNAQNRSDKYFCICNYHEHCAGIMLLSFTDKKSIVIELLSVNVNYQRMGIGSMMMSRLGAFCTENGVTKISVGTQERNCAALEFYKKNNFKIDKKTHIYHVWND